jgi:hypothetical protein
VIFEAIEVSAPQASIGGQPVIELCERLGPDAVEAALRIRASLDEAGVLEDSEVLGHGRLAEPEPIHELTNRPLAFAEQIQDRQPPTLAKHLERGKFGHKKPIYLTGYIPVKACSSCVQGLDAHASQRTGSMPHRWDWAHPEIEIRASPGTARPDE